MRPGKKRARTVSRRRAGRLRALARRGAYTEYEIPIKPGQEFRWRFEGRKLIIRLYEDS
jgi:hypothetical protein